MTRALAPTFARLETAMRVHGIAEAELSDATGRIRLVLGSDAPIETAAPASVTVRAEGAGRIEPLRQTGEAVAAGEILATLATGAVLRPVVAPVAGLLGAWHRAEGTLTGYGDTVAEIATERNT